MEAAFLYNAVKVFAAGADEVLREGGDLRNGGRVVQSIINTGSYRSDIQGIDVGDMPHESQKNRIIFFHQIQIDKNGDSEGNYMLLAMVTDDEGYCNEMGSAFVTVGGFQYSKEDGDTDIAIPVSLLRIQME